MKKISLFLLALVLCLFCPDRIEAKNVGRAVAEVRIDKVQDKVVKEIDQRVQGLKKLIEKIQSMKKISSTQKMTLAAQVQKEIDSLTVLKSGLETEKDLVKLKELRKFVVTSYRIYAVFVPRINMLAYGDSLINIADKMLSLPSVNDTARKIITDSKEETTKAMNMVLSVTPAGYPENKTILHEAKKMLVEARKSLNEAKKQIKNEK